MDVQDVQDIYVLATQKCVANTYICWQHIYEWPTHICVANTYMCCQHIHVLPTHMCCQHLKGILDTEVRRRQHPIINNIRESPLRELSPPYSCTVRCGIHSTGQSPAPTSWKTDAASMVSLTPSTHSGTSIIRSGS